MIREFLTPEVEILEFAREDVITTSIGPETWVGDNSDSTNHTQGEETMQ